MREHAPAETTEGGAEVAPSFDAREALLEVGWVLAGPLSRTVREAVAAARQDVLEQVRALFPEFEWRMPALHHGGGDGARVEAVALLDLGAAEVVLHHWDFAFVLGPGELITEDGTAPTGVVSRAVGVIAAPTQTPVPEQPGALSGTALARRIVATFFHLFGHLNGLDHRAGGFMAPPGPLPAGGFDARERDHLREALLDVADLRLEERSDARRTGTLRFHVRAAWLNRRSILHLLGRARAWEFPFRLPRLTAAAVSTLLLMMISAEAWDVGTTQSCARLAGFATLAYLGATWYVLKKHRLLAPRSRHRLLEQTATADVAIALLVGAGMLGTWILLALVAALIGRLVFAPDLLQRWASFPEQPIDLTEYAGMAAFSASVGLLIGALGASFEAPARIRELAYVDRAE